MDSVLNFKFGLYIKFLPEIFLNFHTNSIRFFIRNKFNKKSTEISMKFDGSLKIHS